MKKSLQKLFIGASLTFAAIGLAQPTLTATGINPVIGDHYTVTSSTVATSPGNAGANQTWNISCTGTAATTSAVAVGTTTAGASFPNANVAVGAGSGYVYYKTSSSALQNYGSITSGIQSYSNPEDLLHFPCTYNSTYTDAFACTYTSSTTIYRNGTVTVTADGYGTLTTPAGTFSNAMRVHIYENYRDSGNISGFPYVSNFLNDEYAWFVNNNHNAIASVASFTTSTSGFNSVTNETSYTNNAVAGIENPAAFISSVSLFPNPAVSNISLNLSLTENKKVEIQVLNILGSEVGKTIVSEGTQGLNDYKLDIANLSEGIYFARISLNGALASTQKFIISK